MSACKVGCASRKVTGRLTLLVAEREEGWPREDHVRGGLGLSYIKRHLCPPSPPRWPVMVVLLIIFLILPKHCYS